MIYLTEVVVDNFREDFNRENNKEKVLKREEGIFLIFLKEKAFIPQKE